MDSAAARDDLTPQQRAAIFGRESSIVLSAGAGCGKTSVLTQRFLSHLEMGEADISQIVAITFTDRAARVMRSRIRKAVLGHLDSADTPEEIGRWEGHLRALETAQICTIHAFCGNLLRQSAFELGIDPGFEVLENILAVNLQIDALRDCLQALLTAKSSAGDDLRELVLLFGWRPTVEALRHLMVDEDSAGWGRWLARPAPEIEADWQQHCRTSVLPRYIAFLLGASPKIVELLHLLRRTPCTGPKMAARVTLLLESLPKLAQAINLAAAVEELTKAAKVAGTERAKAWPSQDVYQQIRKAFTAFRDHLPKALAFFLDAPDDLRLVVETGQRFLRVANEAARAYHQAKRRRGVVDFSDLLIQVRDLVRDHAGVRERLQKRYRFILIDELQDTDPVQMELVHLLTGPALKTGKLFAVGDHAQAIYRFRRADVRLFQELKKEMPAGGQLALTKNFRSQPGVLDFVNALFGPTTPAGTDARMQDYERLDPHHKQLNDGPCVEFLWAQTPPKALAAEARATEADWLARRLAAMIGGGETLVHDDSRKSLRPVRPGDIVILFRAMTQVQIYEEALRRYQLDYYLVGGRAFFAQQEIYDLLNLLRGLENPQDSVSLAGTLRSPFCCLSDEALFLLSRPRGGLWVGLHDDETCARLPGEQSTRALRARRWLDRWRQLKDRLPIAGLFAAIFSDTGYDAALQFERLGDRKLANLWKLQEMARAFDRSGLFGLAEFIARLGDLVARQPREEQAATQPENADVVRLMSIHQAKGLEFPVVVLADIAAERRSDRWPAAHWDPRLGCLTKSRDDPPAFADFGWKLWQANEEIENWHEDLRTLYVACTRAEDYLILSASMDEDFQPENAWMLTLAERFDLASGACLHAKPKARVTDWRAPPPSARQLPALPKKEVAGVDTTASFVPGDLAVRERHEVPAAAVWDAEDGRDQWTWNR